MKARVKAAIKHALLRSLALHPLYALLLSFAALVRASSYACRPPDPTATSVVIEGSVGYANWAAILTCASLMVLAGMCPRFWLVGMAGHSVAIFAYVTFTVSIIWASVEYDQSWSTAGSTTALAVMHFGRILRIYHDQEEIHCGPV